MVALSLYLATLLITMWAAGVSRRTARAASGVMVVVTLLMALLAVPTSAELARGLVALWAGALTVATLCLVVLRIVRHEVITLQTVLGALSAYLLIGFVFTASYTVAAVWGPSPFFTGGEPVTGADLQYFSFVTLTTTGYGDLAAASSAGRALAVMEALLGQIFLVTLVARFVSVFGTTRTRPPAARPEGSAAAGGLGAAREPGKGT